MRVYSKLTVNGPIKMPTGPKSEIPPSTEKRIKRGGMFVFPPTTSGLKKLSIAPTTIVAQTKRPIADVISPVKKRKIIAGIETKAVPKVGIREETAATTPQSAGLGILKNQSPKPINVP